MDDRLNILHILVMYNFFLTISIDKIKSLKNLSLEVEDLLRKKIFIYMNLLNSNYLEIQFV